MTIYTNSTGTTVVTEEDVPRFAMMTLRSAIKLYAKTGIRVNRSYTPTAMKRTVEKWTGETFKRGDWSAMIAALDAKIGDGPQASACGQDEGTGGRVVTVEGMPAFTATIYWPDRDELVQYPYHLGTIESVARDCVPDLWKWRPDWGRKESIALWHEGRVVDYWDGSSWSSDMTVELGPNEIAEEDYCPSS